MKIYLTDGDKTVTIWEQDDRANAQDLFCAAHAVSRRWRKTASEVQFRAVNNTEDGYTYLTFPNYRIVTVHFSIEQYIEYLVLQGLTARISMEFV